MSIGDYAPPPGYFWSDALGWVPIDPITAAEREVKAEHDRTAPAMQALEQLISAYEQHNGTTPLVAKARKALEALAAQPREIT